MAAPKELKYFQTLLSIFLLVVGIGYKTVESCRCLDNYDSRVSYYHDVSCYGLNTTEEVVCAKEFLANISASNTNFQMTLNLYSSSLQAFPSSFLEDYSVTGILLEACKMSKIPKQLIRPVSFTLTTLQIRNSNIKKLSASAFPECYMLSSLILHNSKVKTIAKDAFQNLFNLQELDLRQNLIHTIIGFSGIDSLKMLNLAHNRIKRISEDAFKSTPLLNTIFLNNNHLETLETGIFGSLPELQYLDLNHNRLQTFGGFTGVGALRMLNLSSNNIQNVDVNSFRDMNNLWMLYLDHNNLTALIEGIFNPLGKNPNITLVSLKSNPLHCNCSMKWLQSWFTEHPNVHGGESTTCSSPVIGPLMSVELCDPPMLLHDGKAVTTMPTNAQHLSGSWTSTKMLTNTPKVQDLSSKPPPPTEIKRNFQPDAKTGGSKRTRLDFAILMGLNILLMYFSYIST